MILASKPLYRARQFFHALGALVNGGQESKADAAILARYLSPPQRALFNAMPAPDRHHSLAVLHTLQRMGETDPDLMTAALLHDVGKSEYDAAGRRIRTVPLWCRVAKVAIMMLPRGDRLLRRLSAQGAARPKGMRHAFYLIWEHPRLGAELATRLGVSTQCAALIRDHMRPRRATDPPLLAALKRADDMN
jgi:HD domain